jgi:hypothetical protein
MCVSANRARFRATVVYCGRVDHPTRGHIEVLGYQNTAINRSIGPNAMLLHLPAKSIDPSHFIDVGREDHILQTMRHALERPARRRRRGLDGEWVGPPRSKSVHVFDHDIYTVVLAQDANDIPHALELVPLSRRPSLSARLYEFYANTFPRHSIALCCFDNREAQRAKPLMMWYEPLERDLLVAPAVDCHSGMAPRLWAPVRRQHWVVFGHDGNASCHGYGMHWGVVPDELAGMLPRRIIGEQRNGWTRNGDFMLSYDDLLAGRTDRTKVGLLQ